MTKPIKGVPSKTGPKDKLAGVDVSQVERMATIGLPEKDIAFLMDVSTATVGRFKKKSPEFDSAIRKGRILGHNRIAQRLFEKADSGNMLAIMFYLCNRHPDTWRSVNRTEVQMQGALTLSPTDNIGRRIAASAEASDAAARFVSFLAAQSVPAVEPAQIEGPDANTNGN